MGKLKDYADKKSKYLSWQLGETKVLKWLGVSELNVAGRFGEQWDHQVETTDGLVKTWSTKTGGLARALDPLKAGDVIEVTKPAQRTASLIVVKINGEATVPF